MIAIAYVPALRGGFVWDDDSWTTKMGLHDVAGLFTIWSRPTTLQQYYPLTATSFWLDYQFWKFWPLPYHAENLALHATAALLFWRVLRRLEIPGAWLASAVFALHPIMVESAAWITERKNVLSVSLFLASLLVYLRHVAGREDAALPAAAPVGRASRTARRLSVSYAVAWLLFVAALLAKPTTFALPAVILLLTWWRRGRLRWRQDVLPTLPFFVAAAAMCTMTAWLEKNHLGAQGRDFALTFPQRLLIAGRAFWFYVGKLVWPANLSFVYPRWQPDTGAWWQWLYPAAAVGALVTVWQARRRIGRGPATAAFIFAGTLFPLLGFANVYFMRYSFVCDHWTYLPSLSLIALAAAGATTMFRIFRPERMRFLAPAAGAALLLGFGVLTWRQAGTYADLETLWRSTIARNPESWMAHNSLGNALFRERRVDEAIAEFRQALRLKPDLAEGHTSLGVAFASTGKIDEATSQFREAVRVNPDYAEAHFDLGLALAMRGRLDEGIEHFQEAIRLRPNFPQARSSLAQALSAKERSERSADRPAEPTPPR